MASQTKKGDAGSEPASPNVQVRNEFRRFYMGNQDGLAWKIATGDIDLTKTDNRVWIALQCRAENWNYVRETQKHVAGLIGMAQSHFNASVRRLIELDMVIRTPDTGKGSWLMISPFVWWKGSASEQKGAMAMYRRLASRARAA